MLPYTVADYKKYVFARAWCGIRRIEEIVTALDAVHGFDPEDSDDLAYLFDNAVRFLSLAGFCDDHRTEKKFWDPTRRNGHIGEGVDTYEDGRPVTATVRYGDGRDEYVTHIWHPDPLHPDNRPGAVIEFSQGPSPFRYRYLIVTAPGIIDTIPEAELSEEVDQ